MLTNGMQTGSAQREDRLCRGLPGGHSHHGQFNVRHYRKVVQTAAGYHTTVNAHEPIKDTEFDVHTPI